MPVSDLSLIPAVAAGNWLCVTVMPLTLMPLCTGSTRGIIMTYISHEALRGLRSQLLLHVESTLVLQPDSD